MIVFSTYQINCHNSNPLSESGADSWGFLWFIKVIAYIMADIRLLPFENYPNDHYIENIIHCMYQPKQTGKKGIRTQKRLLCATHKLESHLGNEMSK